MRTVLITGGAGFIGSNAANILCENGYEVTALDSLVLGRRNYLKPQVRFIEGNVENPADLDKVGPVDYIIHLAASSSAPMFMDQLPEAFRNNVMGHVHVLEHARRHGVKKLLFASTSSIYGNNPVPLHEEQPVTPPNFYAVSKHCQEELSQVFSATYGLETIAFRFMSVYGRHEEHKGRFANLVSQFLWGMEQGRSPVIYGDGSQTRDFTNVADLIQAFRLALETDRRFGFAVLNVGTAHCINMVDLVALLNDAMGTSIQPEFIVNPIATGYVQQQLADLTRIEQALGYQPQVTLEQGVRDILEYRRVNPVAPAGMSY